MNLKEVSTKIKSVKSNYDLFNAIFAGVYKYHDDDAVTFAKTLTTFRPAGDRLRIDLYAGKTDLKELHEDIIKFTEDSAAFDSLRKRIKFVDMDYEALDKKVNKLFKKIDIVDKARTRTGTIASFKTNLYADIDKDFVIETDEINYMMYRRVKDVIVVILGVLDDKGKVSTTAFVYRYKDHKFTKIVDKKAIELINSMVD